MQCNALQTRGHTDWLLVMKPDLNGAQRGCSFSHLLKAGPLLRVCVLVVVCVCLCVWVRGGGASVESLSF